MHPTRRRPLKPSHLLPQDLWKRTKRTWAKREHVDPIALPPLAFHDTASSMGPVEMLCRA